MIIKDLRNNLKIPCHTNFVDKNMYIKRDVKKISFNTKDVKEYKEFKEEEYYVRKFNDINRWNTFKERRQ